MEEGSRGRALRGSAGGWWASLLGSRSLFVQIWGQRGTGGCAEGHCVARPGPGEVDADFGSM